MSGGISLGVQLLTSLLALGFVASLAAVPLSIGARLSMGFTDDILEVGELPTDVPPIQNSAVLAADGSLIAEISYQERREPVELDDVPQVLIDAVLATEDNEFFEHRGVNHRSIVRAALGNVSAGEIDSGASTITQQYIKNAYLSSEQTLDRKITEAVWAIELERQQSKDWILENYLNIVYLGNGNYGVGTAARYYFDKDIDELDLAESAMLAGMIRAPIANDPTSDPEAAIARRDIVLNQMQTNGLVSAEQAEQAKAITVEDMLNINEPDPSLEPFWTDWVTRLLVDEQAAEGLGTQMVALRAMGATSEDRIARVFQGGLRIQTTLDPSMQSAAQEAISEILSEPATDPLGGLVSVEPGDGAIRTMAIGPKEFGECVPGDAGVTDDGRMLCSKTKFNPLIPADSDSSRVGRQPGSSFKPIVITAALEQGLPPGWSTNANGPQTIRGCGAPWKVNNSGGNGIHNMYTGVKASSNVFHAKLIADIGPGPVVETARRLGIKRSPLPEVCSLALGAVEIFPLEMATAYATLANMGEYCAPYAIEKITDAQGNVLYQHTPNCKQVVEEDVAKRVVDIMDGPVQSGGTAPIANLGRWDTRGKTGTTNDYVDAWFVGYIKQLATASWIGYENGAVTFDTRANANSSCENPISETEYGFTCLERRVMSGVSIGGRAYRRIFGGTLPAPMWKAYMSAIVDRYEPAQFPDAGGLPATTVPNLLQAGSVNDARRIANNAKLNFSSRTVSHWSPAGTFVSQTPSAGARVAAGSTVTLQISDGTGQRPSVPDVVGMEQEAAVAALQGAGYGVGVTTRPIANERFDGVVISQDPLAGSPAPQEGERVVTITVGSAVDDIERVDDDDSSSGEGDGGTPPPDDGDNPEDDGDDDDFEELPILGGNESEPAGDPQSRGGSGSVSPQSNRGNQSNRANAPGRNR